MELTAERIVAGGDALARGDDGRIVLIEGALPGERVRVEITHDRTDHMRARAVEIIEAAPERIRPPCEYARAGCGGCTWQHIEPAAQPALKVEIVRDALQHIARLETPPPITPVDLPTAAYRTTVRALVVDGRAAFRRHQTHDPIVFDTCLVAHPLVDDVLTHGRFGDAEEVAVRASATTGERSALTEPHHARIDVASDVQTGKHARIHEVIHGRRLRVSAGAFFQSRSDGAAALAALVRDAVGSQQRVADLYCGVGLFAAFVDDPLEIVAVEHDRVAVADAQHNLHELPARVLHLDVTRWRPEPVDVVIADPSRAGLGKAAAKIIVGTQASRIVLVSCDAAALARDATLLHDAGYDLNNITVVDLFPHTPHVECVSVFDKI